MASVLIFSSLAGCLGGDDDEEYADIVVSTYHVEQIVSAIVGDSKTVEILAPSNVPVHDYEPSPSDLVRLKNAEMFFYHGLGLETWVDATLDSLGSGDLVSVETHKMPTGEVDLTYESILKADICELLAEGPFVTSELIEHENHADDLELHAERVVNTLTFPSEDHDDHGDDHDDHGDDHDDHDHDDHGDDHDDHSDDHDDHDHDDHGDDHDDHGDDHDDHDHDDHGDDHDDHGDDHDDHDDHSGHEDHDHAKAVESFTEIDGCPTDTVIDVYELEEGEYVLEFESDHEEESFHMAALKMGGAHHHHHDHGDEHGDDHDDHGDDHDDDHDDHGDNHDDHDHDDHSDDHDDHGDDHDDHDDDHDDHGDNHDDHGDGHGHIGYATIHIEAEGEYGFAVPSDIKMYILKGEDGHEGHDHGDSHDDHDDHGDDHDDHDDHGDDHDDHSDEEALEYDPHSWLDPVAYKAQVDLVLAELIKKYPDLQSTFEANAASFKASLDKLDQDFEAALGDNGTCTNRTVAANHNAYSYMAFRYDIEFVTVHGLDPEGTPAASDIKKVVDKIAEDEITVLFVEEYTHEKSVDSLVDQTKSDSMPDGVDVEILYTMELPPKDSSDNYLSLMQKNLDALKSGLDC